jgi:hypothetical protein
MQYVLMQYNLDHDSLLDVMLLGYMEYIMKDEDLTPGLKWTRVCDIMQHLSQQGIAEFLMSHCSGYRKSGTVYELRRQLWAERDAEEAVGDPGVDRIDEHWEEVLPPQESEE